MSDRGKTAGGRAEKSGHRRPRPAPDPVMMLWACRKLAADLRAEAAMGRGPVPLNEGEAISRAEAAARMDRRGDLWAAKVAGQ